MLAALRGHWPEYAMEAAGLGSFMMAAVILTVLLYHPASPLAGVAAEPVARRACMGLAMGLTAVALIYSPWGRRSGAHLNPAVTLTFFRLRKIAGWDALFYTVAQTAGGLAGMLLAVTLTRGLVVHPSVRYAATVPGAGGAGVAFVAETLISFGLMAVVLHVSNDARLMRFTGLCAGTLVATWITLEAPLSGMSMNPARSFASAVPGHVWTAFWVYLTAPPLGMLLAAELHARLGRRPVHCAKLDHGGRGRCIFRCGYAA